MCVSKMKPQSKLIGNIKMSHVGIQFCLFKFMLVTTNCSSVTKTKECNVGGINP